MSDVDAVPAQSVLEALVETTDDAVFSHDADGIITSWNPAAERFFGYPADDIVGQPSVGLFPAHVRSGVGAVFETVASGDRVRQFETEILRRDGMPMPISLSLSPVLDDDGRPVASILVARDITEQRLAQAALAEVEARVRESEALAHVGSWLWDRRTGAVQWSDEFHRIHGVDPLEFDGTLEGHLGVVHPDDQARVREEMAASVASARPLDSEYRIVRADDAVRRLRVRAQPTIDSRGNVAGLRGIGQDVTAG